jgi:3-ketosteroid 9alpha-monooxygenase subunit A
MLSGYAPTLFGPPTLSPSEFTGFTAIREWARQFYPDGRGGSAAELQSTAVTHAP